MLEFKLLELVLHHHHILLIHLAAIAFGLLSISLIKNAVGY